MIALGDKVADSVTGFQGIVEILTKYRTGHTAVGVQSQVLKDGIPIEVQWFKEPQLLVVQKGDMKVYGTEKDPGRETPSER